MASTMLSSSASLSLSARRNVGGGVAARKPVRVQTARGRLFSTNSGDGVSPNSFFFVYALRDAHTGDEHGGEANARVPAAWTFARVVGSEGKNASTERNAACGVCRAGSAPEFRLHRGIWRC